MKTGKSGSTRMSGYAAPTTIYVAIKFGAVSTRPNSLSEGEGVIN